MPTDRNFAEGLSLIPVSTVALGTPDAPVERLIGLQSAIARCVGWLADPRLPRLPMPFAASRLYPTHQGDLR
jgi:hypothetical protein